MRPGTLVVRAVEYEVLPRDQAGTVGLNPAEVKEHFRDQGDLAVVKCVCVGNTGEKFTCITDARHFKGLIDTGEAADPAGMTVSPARWPVVLRGWRQAS